MKLKLILIEIMESLQKGLRKIIDNQKKFFSDRLVLMGAGILILFSVTIFSFYQLQIINYEQYEGGLRASVESLVEIPATRGIIYDRYGKHLAINKPVYVLQIDQQVRMDKKQLNAVLLKTAQLLDANGDTYIDQIPISQKAPYTFTESEGAVRIFVNSLPFNGIEHRDELLTYTAEELLDYMISKDVFQIDLETHTREEARKICALRYEMLQFAYQKYKMVTIAENISQKTLSMVEENYVDYPSVTMAIMSYRYYPYGKEFGNVLGYMRRITAEQFSTLQDEGYDKDDIIGQVGIEYTMEQELKGQKGLELIEKDNVGRRVSTLDREAAVPGNDVFLTLDANLQVETYNIMEKQLSAAIISRLKGDSRDAKPLKGREVLVSMVENNQISLRNMEMAPEEEMRHQLYQKLITSYVDNSGDSAKDKTLKGHFMDLLEAEPSSITNRELLLALDEEGTMVLTTEQRERVRNGSNFSLEDILITALESGRLKPDQMAITPYSAAAVVVDVNTGDVLTVVGYPSYDSNEMTNNFNSLFTMLHDGFDKRNLLWNRALKTTRAPGSTFKMITGIAGLEEGVVDSGTVMNDTGLYTKAGEPYAKCWIHSRGYGHGNVDIHRALSVSCNYYFYDIAYRLNMKYGFPYGGINVLADYMRMFGLGDKTGIELDETAPNISDPATLVNTNVVRAVNSIKNMTDERIALIQGRLDETLLNGFYPYGSSKDTEVDGRIDYLTQYEAKLMLDEELEYALGGYLEEIVEGALKDFSLGVSTSTTQKTKQIAEAVLADTNDRSLKAKAKDYISKMLMGMYSVETTTMIQKSLKEIDDEMLDIAYRTIYNNAYNRNKNKNENPEVLAELERRIAAIDALEFDGRERLVVKVEERIVAALVDYLFERVEMEWSTAITIRTAIGQGYNAYAPVHMARYIAGLANGKSVYDLTLINGVQDHKGSGVYEESEPVLYNTLDIKQSTLNDIYLGMYEVVKGREGTARNQFAGFPLDAAGKTGTAQEGEDEHSWFVGFAPYDAPEVAVVTSMYAADGLGKYNYSMAREILDAYFGFDREVVKTTMDNELSE